MKNLSKFMSEGSEDPSQPHMVGKGKNTDDKEYIDLMGQYKQARYSDQEKAADLFMQAQELLEKGNISAKAKLAVAYL